MSSFFSKTRWDEFFEPPFPQDNSSESSPIMPDEFGDQKPFLHTESLQIHKFVFELLLSSSVHSSSVAFRTGTDMAEAHSVLSDTFMC